MPHEVRPPSSFHAEAIARVLDGRASAEERARLLAEADQSPELLALLADSAAALNAETDAGAVPIQSRNRPRWRAIAWAGLAAAGILAVAVPQVLKRGDQLPQIPRSGIVGAGALEQARLGAPIQAVRGGGTRTSGPQSATIGARIVDYRAVGSDTSAATIGIEIAAALRMINGASMVASEFEATTPVTPELISAVEQVLDVKRFRAAMWAETIRLAAIDRDSVLMLSVEGQAALSLIASDGALPRATRSAAAQIQALVRAKPIDWKAIEFQAAALLGALTG